MNTPSTNVNSTDANANPKFHSSVPRNGPEIRGSVNTRVRLSSPTLTRHPGTSSSPSRDTNDPAPSSAYQRWPVAVSTTQSQSGW